MLKIGDFSKLSRVSVRMLRHYDDIGLLKPAETDAFTGYRYYREDQLPVMGRITALKDMGFALADIVRILEIYEDRDQLDAFLAAREEELLHLSKETEYKLTLLGTARKRLREERNMRFNVTVRTIPERYAATVQGIVPHYEDEGLLWGMMAECRTPLIPAEPCLAAAAFLDKEYKEENVEIQVSMTVRGTCEDTAHVKFRTLPAVRVASCVVKGSYAQMGEATAAVAAWIHENGYRVNGPMFNIYHVSPNETSNPDDYVTELCFPIE